MTQIVMHDVGVAQFIRLLGQLAVLLDKAQVEVDAGRQSESALLQRRLIADMYPLAKQVQIACDKARSVAARLAGIEVPKYKDDEQTLAELKHRIARTIAFLRGLRPEQVNGSEDKEIELPVTGKPMRFVGLRLLLDHSLPNVYFHVVTAYALLRQAGVPVGKRDYLG